MKFESSTTNIIELKELLQKMKIEKDLITLICDIVFYHERALPEEALGKHIEFLDNYFKELNEWQDEHGLPIAETITFHEITFKR